METAVMEEIGQKIASALERLDLDQSKLSRLISKRTGVRVSRVTINRIINGETKDPRDTTLSLIMRVLTELEREQGDGLPPGSDYDPFAEPEENRSGWLPELGNVAAGKPTDFELTVLGDKSVPPSLYRAPQEYPATIIATGDSMTPLIDGGDVVFIARRFRRPPQSGDIVAVSFVQEGGHHIKRLEILPDGRWRLEAINHPKHAHRTMDPQQDLKAVAVVVGWYHPVHKPQAKKR